MRTTDLFTLVAGVSFVLAPGTSLAQSDSQLQGQLDALDKRIDQSQQAWDKAYLSSDQFSLAETSRWFALLDARSRELNWLRDARSQLVQQANGEYATRAKELNSQIQQFKGSNLVASSNIDFLGDLARNPKRQDFERTKEQLSQEWQSKYGEGFKRYRSAEEKSIDEGFKKWFPEGKDLGYRRIGQHNPYTGEYYVRFYTDKEGDLKFGAWQEASDAWQRWKEDANKTWWRRLDRERQEYLRQANEVKEKLDGFIAAEQKAANQVSQVRSQVAEAIRKQREESQTEPGIGAKDGIRYKNGYPIAPDHLKIPNYNGPRWVNGILVN